MNQKEFTEMMRLIEFGSFHLAQVLLQQDPDHPIPPFTTRFEGRLESAIGSAFQSFGGKYVIEPLTRRYAALFYYMTRGHCFSNGNKRIALMTLFTVIFLRQGWLRASDQECYALSQRVAVSPKEKKDEVIDWVHQFLLERLIDKEKI